MQRDGRVLHVIDLAGPTLHLDVDVALHSAGDVEAHGGAIGQPHLLAGDVADRQVHLVQGHLGGGTAVVGRHSQRRAAVTLVHPMVEFPDRHEAAVGSGPDRRDRPAVEDLVVECLELRSTPVPHLGGQRRQLRSAHGRRCRDVAGDVAEGRRRFHRFRQPARQGLLYRHLVGEHAVDGPIRAVRLHLPLIAFQRAVELLAACPAGLEVVDDELRLTHGVGPVVCRACGDRERCFSAQAVSARMRSMISPSRSIMASTERAPAWKMAVTFTEAQSKPSALSTAARSPIASRSL